MILVKKVHARQILDSRGNPTVEVVLVSDSSVGVGAVPSGASTGKYESVELRDSSSKDYFGKSVKSAINNVNRTICKKIVGRDFASQKDFDECLIRLDGTQNKSVLGANAILGCSLAFARAFTASKQGHLFQYFNHLSHHSQNFSLPIPFANVINGGVHAGTDLVFQEFMVVPFGAKSFAQATQMVVEIYNTLKLIIRQVYGVNATNVGDEGGFVPPIKTPDQALTLLRKATKKAGYSGKVGFAIDVAASEFYNPNQSKYFLSSSKSYSSVQLVKFYESLVAKYPEIVSIEDPFDQDDFYGWKTLNESLGKKILIVGDDLTVSNLLRITTASENNLCNTLLLKLNQIGSVTQGVVAAKYARSLGWNVIVSHRSGETEDPFISDLAVGLGCGMIKLGAPARAERTAKYNQLLRLEEFLFKKAKFASLSMLR